MRIGILGHRFVNWVGGIDFLRTVIDSLLAADPDRSHSYFLLLPIEGAFHNVTHAYGNLLNCMAKALPFNAIRPRNRVPIDLVRSSFSDLEGKVNVINIDSGFRSLKLHSTRLNLDVLLPAAIALPRSFPIPWVGYIADLQHKHLVGYFDVKERSRRDDLFRSILQSTTIVVVNAQFTADDVMRNYPDTTADVVPLPFNAAPKEVWLAGTSPVQQRTFPNNFFLISNQFWVHKDHATAFRALALVVEHFPDVRLICTGDTNDFRNPGHFGFLTRILRDLGLTEHVTILGLIPKASQIDLLRNSVALIQPSLFEGGRGGGAANEAIALGVPAIVSNIAVNLELSNLENVYFFEAANPDSLASMMLRMLAVPRREEPDPERLISIGYERQAACGRVLLDAARHCHLSFSSR